MRERLRERDAAMVREYLRNLKPGARDLRFVFEAGDLVLLKPRAQNKQEPNARGPYVFVGYLRGRLTAILRDDAGHMHVESVANLMWGDA